MSVSIPAKEDRGYALGVKFLEKRQVEKALSEFKAVVANQPQHAEAQFQIARIYILTNQFERALEPLRQAISIKPDSKVLWFAYSEAVALGGDQKAEAKLLSDLKNSLSDAQLRISLQDRFTTLRKSSRPALGGMNRAQAKQMLVAARDRKFDDLEKLALRALRKFPKSAMSANMLAVAQSALGKPEVARKSFMSALKLDPDYADAYYNYGRLLVQQGSNDEATNCFKRAVTLAPGMLQALVVLSVSLNGSKHHRAAKILLERAVKENPTDMIANLELGNVCVKMNEYDRAEKQYETARALSKGEISLEHRLSLAQMQSKNGKDESALANFDAVLDQEPNNAVALTAKAGLLQSFGQFDEARKIFKLAIAQDPQNGEAYRMFVSSEKIKANDPIIDDMIGVADSNKLTSSQRMNISFAISKALEDAKRDSEVFGYLNEANKLMRNSYPFSMQTRFDEINALRKAYDNVNGFDTAQGCAPEQPAVFITGMPRSGTTLVEQIIASHSRVTSGGELGHASGLARELVVRSEGLRSLADVSDEEFSTLSENYRNFIRDRFEGADCVTDKTITTYMHIGPLKLAMPNAKFIVVRRDPRDNLFSIYKNKFPDGTHAYAYNMEDLARFYTTFVDMIDFWRERIPDWFYEVQYEDLVANPEKESRKLIAACGLEWEDACLNFHENKNKVQTLSVYQVRQPISKASVKGWKRFEKDIEPMLKILREDGHVTD